jgi:glucose-1-phosphate thymidylyltransferase
LGDNIFEDDFTDEIKQFKQGGKIFAKQVPDPERFGVVDFAGSKVKRIVEKPKEFVSDYAVTGLYLYDYRAVQVAKELKPSERGELEITDVNNWFLAKDELEVAKISGAWLDAGTFDSLLEAQNIAKEKLAGKMVI